MNLEKFFDPKSVAVIGASSDPKKVGYALVKNLSQNKNIKVFPVNLENKEIPENIDLAVIAVRADLVPQILKECGKKKIKNAIIISSGFKETGEAGKELENQVSKIAQENGINLLGPNCLGIINTKNNLNASFAVQKPLPGKIALLSQSGALGTAMIDWAVDEGVGFSKFISLGNEVQLTEIDFLKYLKDDSDTESILIYLEKLSDGPAFMELVKEITKTKPIVVLKAGRSTSGIKAISSHTGSLAPDDVVFSSACKQSGVITVNSIREFFNMAKLFQMGITKPLQKITILTNGGGPSVVATDLIETSHSLILADLGEETKEKLKKVLPPMASVQNPVDILGDALSDRFENALKILVEEKETDAIFLLVTPQMMTEIQKTNELVKKYFEQKPIIPVFMGGHHDFVNFNFAKDVVEVLDNLAFLRPLLRKLPQRRGLGEGKISLSQMLFSDMSKILNEYNIKISGKFIKNKDELYNALNEYGEGPYAMKIISPDIIHKTEVGAVKLNIKNIEEAKKVWDEMYAKNSKLNIEGILVQKMSAGREIIIGIKRDATFGPTILFGLGGIFTEAIKDTTIRIASLEKEEALKMMHEIKGIKILQGLRGQPPVNFDLLADIIVNLSHLATEHPEIKEIDLNPVMATENSATIVDARVMI